MVLKKTLISHNKTKTMENIKIKNKTFLFTYLLIILGYASSCQHDNHIEWSEFKIKGTKKVETKYLGLKDSIEWPIFDDAILLFDKKMITIEGYYFTMESMDLESLKMKHVCLLTIAKKPTIKICGVAQFRQNEFLKLSAKINAVPGKKITIKGILRINKDGSKENLLSLDDPEVM